MITMRSTVGKDKYGGVNNNSILMQRGKCAHFSLFLFLALSSYYYSAISQKCLIQTYIHAYIDPNTFIILIFFFNKLFLLQNFFGKIDNAIFLSIVFYNIYACNDRKV